MLPGSQLIGSRVYVLRSERMRNAISFVVAAAMVVLPIQRMLRRSYQRKMLHHLEDLGWGLGESEKLYLYYYGHGPGRV